jgi:hypothetical protein
MKQAKNAGKLLNSDVVAGSSAIDFKNDWMHRCHFDESCCDRCLAGIYGVMTR